MHLSETLGCGVHEACIAGQCNSQHMLLRARGRLTVRLRSRRPGRACTGARGARAPRRRGQPQPVDAERAVGLGRGCQPPGPGCHRACRVWLAVDDRRVQRRRAQTGAKRSPHAGSGGNFERRVSARRALARRGCLGAVPASGHARSVGPPWSRRGRGRALHRAACLDLPAHG